MQSIDRIVPSHAAVWLKQGGLDMKTNNAIFKEVKDARVVAYDEALGKLAEAGIAEAFLVAIKDSPNFHKVFEKADPFERFGPGPVADWSCCITSANPVRNAKDAVINPGPAVITNVAAKMKL